VSGPTHREMRSIIGNVAGFSMVVLAMKQFLVWFFLIFDTHFDCSGAKYASDSGANYATFLK